MEAEETQCMGFKWLNGPRGKVYLAVRHRRESKWRKGDLNFKHDLRRRKDELKSEVKSFP